MGKGLPRSHKGANAQKGTVQKLNISLDKLSVTVTSVAAAIGFGSAVDQGLPEGNVQILGMVLSNFQLSGSGSDANLSDTWAGDFGLGTTPADDATITAGDVDLVASTALAAATAEVSPLATRTVGVTPTMIPIDNTANDLRRAYREWAVVHLIRYARRRLTAPPPPSREPVSLFQAPCNGTESIEELIT